MSTATANGRNPLAVRQDENGVHSTGTPSGLLPHRPFWQTEPCPPWCDAASNSIGHTSRDEYSEREHWHTQADIPLTLCEGDLVGAEADSMPPEMTVSVFQHYRAATPDVLLGVPVATGYHDYAVHDVHMTVDEARALRDALSAVLAMVGNEPQAGAR